jgi:hypothetical protein
MLPAGAFGLGNDVMLLLRAILFAFCILGLASPLSANPLEEELAALSNSCWERTYDAAHLKAHPRQRVTKIRLSTEVQDDGNIVASLGINLRQRLGGQKFDYSAFGRCEARQDFLACPSEWEAGTFVIEKAKGGILVYNKGMIVNPSNYDAEDIAPGSVDLSKSDDKAWLLSRIEDEGCDLY